VFVRERVPEIVVAVAALVFFGRGVSKNGYGQTYYAAAGRHWAPSKSNGSTPAPRHVIVLPSGSLNQAISPMPRGDDLTDIHRVLTPAPGKTTAPSSPGQEPHISSYRNRPSGPGASATTRSGCTQQHEPLDIRAVTIGPVEPTIP
jgi:hypothetical protein